MAGCSGPDCSLITHRFLPRFQNLTQMPISKIVPPLLSADHKCLYPF